MILVRPVRGHVYCSRTSAGAPAPYTASALPRCAVPIVTS